MTTTILIGDCRAEMAKLEPGSVHCVVTSPPYWGLRDYGIEPGMWGGDADCAHEWADSIHSGGGGQPGEKVRWNHTGAGPSGHPKITTAFCTQCSAWRGTFGLEPTYQLYVEHSVEIFRAVKRILRADGTLWLNLGDSYTSNQSGGLTGSTLSKGGEQTTANRGFQKPRAELKNKDLCGIPWRVAFALQSDGWYLRRDIIWHKPNPMPESTTDRCTTAHEYLFHFSKSERYVYDAEAIKEPASSNTHARYKMPDGGDTAPGAHGSYHRNGREKGQIKIAPAGSGVRANDSMAPAINGPTSDRNKRSVWTIATSPFPEAHFATFPPALIEPCILAGCPQGGTVFDPFFGAGTTGLVAQRLNRNAIGCELNPDYAKMAQARLEADKMTKESGKRHMAKSLNKEKPWTAETLFAPTGTGNHYAGTNAEGDSTDS